MEIGLIFHNRTLSTHYRGNTSCQNQNQI